MNFLETNGVTIHIDNGAMINFKALHEKNGAIVGCTVTNNSGKVNISRGTLAIRGYRIEFTQNEDVYDINSYQTSDTSNYLVIAKISVNQTQRSSSLEFIVKRESSGLTQNNIEEGSTGVFEYPLVRFAKSSNVITTFTSLVSQIVLNDYEVATDEEIKELLGIS